MKVNSRPINGFRRFERQLIGRIDRKGGISANSGVDRGRSHVAVVRNTALTKPADSKKRL